MNNIFKIINIKKHPINDLKKFAPKCKKEIQKRFQKLKLKKNQFSRGYKKLYLDSILPASEGCDFNFL